MFENIMNFFRKLSKKQETSSKSKDTAKERLHLVLMQDRANVSADFLDLMRQEIIDVIKKYIEVDESAIDVRLTNKENEDGTNGAPALYANIPIVNIKEDAKKLEKKEKAKKEKNTKEKKDNVDDEQKQTTVNEETAKDNKDIPEESQKTEKAENDTEQKNDSTEEKEANNLDKDIENKETNNKDDKNIDKEVK